MQVCVKGPVHKVALGVSGEGLTHQIVQKLRRKKTLALIALGPKRAFKDYELKNFTAQKRMCEDQNHEALQSTTVHKEDENRLVVVARRHY